jgi:hypothetical protein
MVAGRGAIFVSISTCPPLPASIPRSFARMASSIQVTRTIVDPKES